MSSISNNSDKEEIIKLKRKISNQNQPQLVAEACYRFNENGFTHSQRITQNNSVQNQTYAQNYQQYR